MRMYSMPRRMTSKVDQPESDKANSGAVRNSAPDGRERQKRVDGFAADPGLNAEPSASDEGAQDGGDIGAEDSEGRAG